MAPLGGLWGEWWTLSRLSQEGGRIPVVSDNVTEAVTDLSIPELFGEVQANQHGTIQVGRGLILLRGRGAEDFVSHAVMMPRIRTLWGKWWTVPQLVGQPT